jgi:sugar O-acyltransferase (sialic acid O-acetyltransferase NeuD family)
LENPVIIFGAGPEGIAAMEAFEQNSVIVYGFLDDVESNKGKEIGTVTVLGSPDDDGFLKLIGKKCEAFVATEDIKLKKHLVEMLKERRNVIPVNCLHQRAYVSTGSELGHGNYLAPGAVLHPQVKIGSYCSINANAQVEAGAKMGDYCTLGAGALIGRGTELADGVFVGSGAVIISGLSIGKNARIGAGSVVISPVPAGKTFFGNPAVEWNK